MTRLLKVLAFLILIAAWVPAVAKDPKVTDIRCRYENMQVVASFEMDEAFDHPDVKEAILSTRPITFTYTVDLIRHRYMWKDKRMARKVVRRTVLYDNLTHQFTIETQIEDLPPTEKVVGTWEEMVEVMRKVEDVPLISVGHLRGGEKRYSVRVKVHLLSDSFLWIIPWDVETDWESIRLKTP